MTSGMVFIFLPQGAKYSTWGGGGVSLNIHYNFKVDSLTLMTSFKLQKTTCQSRLPYKKSARVVSLTLMTSGMVFIFLPQGAEYSTWGGGGGGGVCVAKHSLQL